jgi:hypothetical protein
MINYWQGMVDRLYASSDMTEKDFLDSLFCFPLELYKITDDLISPPHKKIRNQN